MSQAQPLGMEPPGSVQHAPTATETAGGEDRRGAYVRHIVEAALWLLGAIVLATGGYLTHLHKGPWPGELEFSRWTQSVQYWPWFHAVLTFFSSFNDVPPSIIATVVAVLFFLIMRWFRQALFFALTIIYGNGINILIGAYVDRPRPSEHLIHVTQKLSVNSFPSGHTEHDVVFYGTLLYLSFTKSVRNWRYYRYLIPLQIFALCAILCIGYSRVLEGEHWLTDVLGGYLSGLLWLFLFIFIYRLDTQQQAERKANRQVKTQAEPHIQA
ncbi:phosphatase PAP2 family protein [Tengunoibacter tsumagoiensis]|uniref:Phosphatase PAP2 family protein n=1 Tax=Tengunoibacter tsumagoiensis TaxID=2014871 RepID=A0A402AAD2_9CHLR|nr:phosphatase PAP2 family protein [Tengunoibacter tsumagoiensis]GCE16079.1 phosphatase PAP2 family protein [Tengunoibacter tsumagoiensis]